jgi:hypothetical protein
MYELYNHTNFHFKIQFIWRITKKGEENVKYGH